MFWQEYFDSHILLRGYHYYLEGFVEEYKLVNNKIEAIVCGSDDYEIEIDLDKMEFYCSCPHFASGNFCKHLAAVMYKKTESVVIMNQTIIGMKRK